MSYSTLISAAELMTLQAAVQAQGQRLVLVDCSFDLSDTSAGERAHGASHLPGALYAHLDRDLAGATTGRNGRHPLPTRDAFARTLGCLGITPGTQVVAYDNQGAPYAARLWWMLHWMGHSAAAVLDGGPAAWRAAGGAMSEQAPVAATAPPYPERASAMPTVDANALLAGGEVEPLDAVGGHIPGARNHFFKDNLQADGRFKPVAQLRAYFEGLGAPTEVVHQCGSGVTACHNLLAMMHAGLAGSALYPGSWSEWSADATKPVAKGP
jgi:thiosulfate/3-mercaptopyruvate sulfurtransferase